MITVVIPALNECKTIARIVRHMRQSPNVTEVVVVDDGSIDGTPDIALKEGAKVITSTLLGKGASMQDGARAATNECLLYMDGDLSEYAADLAKQMTEPILTNQADFVKARFLRSGGRVTELAAKPLLRLFFPELLCIEQPLGGVIATRKNLIDSQKLENDYGVDIGLLIDMSVNKARISQVDVGFIEHDSQPLEKLGLMAKQVMRTILNRAQRLGRLTEAQMDAVTESERQASANLETTINDLGAPKKLALLDMDGTLIDGRFVEVLALQIGKSGQLRQLLDSPRISPEERSRKIAALLENTPQEVFRTVAMNIPLTTGAIHLVVGLRKRGYAVGIVSDSYYIATEVVRRRVFADFSIAHLLHFQNGLATGNVTISPAMKHVNGCQVHEVCKNNVLHHLNEYCQYMPRIVAIGDNDGDACMLRAADLGIAFEPKTRLVSRSANHVLRGNIASALEVVDKDVSSLASQWTAPYYASKLTSDGI